MLERAGDLGFEQEPTTAGWIVRVLVKDLLERNLSVQLGVERDEDSSEPAFGMRSKQAETRAILWRPSGRVRHRAFAVARDWVSRTAGERTVDLGFAKRLEARARRG
jgi:hypothetical protein